ncbi:hypothetical protein [Streptomyces sp. NPDC048825]|uniref:hypothetical protein n=1 Tax=Streptomyces sp. NPDC048825 TaxID=3365592 RepID=UPI00371E12C8
MKKRSMLAIASLATGFVVAAITPSHGLHADALDNLDVDDAHSTLDRTIVGDGLTVDENPLGEGGQNSRGSESRTSQSDF